jgi:hypothetical protein
MENSGKIVSMTNDLPTGAWETKQRTPIPPRQKVWAGALILFQLVFGFIRLDIPLSRLPSFADGLSYDVGRIVLVHWFFGLVVASLIRLFNVARKKEKESFFGGVLWATTVSTLILTFIALR